MTTPYTTGTISLTNGSAMVTGVGTAWQIALIKGGIVYPEAAGNGLPIATVDSDTQITAAVEWSGASGTYSYALVRDTAYDAQIAQNAEALARLLAGLEAGTIWKYDMSGDTAGRDIYDGKPKGFSYLDVSLGPAQLWVKASNSEGDWAGPFSYGVGPEGPSGPKGMNWRGAWSNATAYLKDDAVSYNNASWIALVDNTNVTPVAGATWGLVAARGATGAAGTSFTYRGTYAAGTAYAIRDVVTYNGSSWIATAATTGNAPPNLPTTSNAYWSLMAAKGTDGTGTGDVVGPAGSADWDLAFFNGATGKLLRNANIKGALDGWKLGPVFGGPPPEPDSAGVDLAAGFDFNLVNYTGLYTIAGTWTNGPTGGPHVGILEVRTRRFTNLYIQTYYDNGGNVWTRRTTTAGGTAGWTEWVKINLPIGTTAGTVAAGDDARFSAGGSSKNEAIFALEIADLKGARLGMNGGVADAFDDESGVNVGGSTNQSYDAANDWYVPSSPGSVRLTGATPTTPLGGTPANINDNNAATTSAWAGGNLTSVTDINSRIIARLDFGTVRAMTRIEVKALRFSSGSATNYLALYYSSDGTTWTKLGSDLSVNTTPTDFAMDGTFNARYVAMIAGQFNISVSVTIGDLNAYGPGTPLNMTLVSVPYTASAAPSNGRLALQTVESEAIAINTDLTIEVSRDNGTTYTAASLSLSTNIGTSKMYEGVVDLSSQPSGTAVRWRVKTLNGKSVAVSGVVMQWS